MPTPQRGRETAEGIISQMQTLESKLNLIAQRIKTMEKNEEILGRTLITLNDKLDKVSKEGFTTSSKGEKVDEAKYATKQEVRELKALLDAINPLEFATVDQVKELMDDALKKRK